MRTTTIPVAYIVSLVQHHGMRYGKASPTSLRRVQALALPLFASMLLVSALATHARAADESIDGEGGGRRVEKKPVSGAVAEPIVPSGANAAGVKPGDKITKA